MPTLTPLQYLCSLSGEELSAELQRPCPSYFPTVPADMLCRYPECLFIVQAWYQPYDIGSCRPVEIAMVVAALRLAQHYYDEHVYADSP